MQGKTFKQIWLEDNYPATIIADRYDGAFSGASWLAFPIDYWDIPDEIDGGDTECYLFWKEYDGIVGKGATPQEAFNNLRKAMEE